MAASVLEGKGKSLRAWLRRVDVDEMLGRGVKVS